MGTGSDDWRYGIVVVAARALEEIRALRVISEWRDGVRTDDNADRGTWRRTHHVR